jgi:biopolymer transport protein ExbD
VITPENPRKLVGDFPVSLKYYGHGSWQCGRVSVRGNKTTVDRTTLQSYISQEAAKNPQPEVHIAVDKFSKYEIVAQTLADLQHRGLKKIGFVNNDFF